MAVVKSISARCLVAFVLDQKHFQPNQVAEFSASTAATLKAMGWIDDDKTAVAYCLKNIEADPCA